MAKFGRTTSHSNLEEAQKTTNLKVFGVKLDDDFIASVKIDAAQKRMKIQDYVREALEEYMNKKA